MRTSSDCGSAAGSASTSTVRAYFSCIQLGNIFLERDDWPNAYRRLLALAGTLLTEPLYSPGLPVPFCLMCAEKDRAKCHRSLIAEFLETKGYEIRHIE